MSKDKKEQHSASVFTPSSIFVTKESYAHVADEFHKFHKHDLNVAAHLFTTGLGIWGAVQLGLTLLPESGVYVVYAYAALIALTTPLMTAILHTAFMASLLQFPIQDSAAFVGLELSPVVLSIAAVCLGYGLQDVAHYVFQEKTYMASYMEDAKPWMLVVHTIWLMPLVIDSITMRWCFIPNVVSRNRNVVTDVASKKAVEDLRNWINKNVPSTRETTHVWPHKQEATSKCTVALEEDSAILAGFRSVFAAKHFDIRPVKDMNEIYVTAVGAKKDINSDAVFYTPHNDGPYWFTPGASLYRVLVGVTPNKMVRTRFNLQHESQDQVLDMYNVVGFDYNRELHWIDHVPGQTNTERRSLLKLHFVVYPKGWHAYGNLVAHLNTTYNTWARNNFLRTLRPSSTYEFVLAWQIWLTTWVNAIFEEYVGWSNLVYVAFSYVLGPVPFLLLTSFRHYVVYMSTFAFRQPAVAHGYLMRDAKLYKTIALMHLARRVLPLVKLPSDIPCVLLAAAGFATTMMATMRLGFVRTYFGSELGFVKPDWIEGFPYGTIPHPMIVGQLFAFGSILAWFGGRLNTPDHVIGTMPLLVAHMSFYTAHMVQEMMTSSY